MEATLGSKTVLLPIQKGCIDAKNLTALGLRLFDPGFRNTTVSSTTVSRLEPDSPALFYRGYPIEELVEKSSFMEVIFLLLFGRLPLAAELSNFSSAIYANSFLHKDILRQLSTFRHDAHPMGMLISTMASISAYQPDANPALQGENLYRSVDEQEKVRNVRNRNIFRILGKVPVIAAYTYSHLQGHDFIKAKHAPTSYCENFLYMMDSGNNPNYVSDSRLVSILEKLFILVAEHGSNCSTVMMKHLTSSGVDPYTAVSGSMAALFGERKCHAVIEMLQQIGRKENITKFLSLVKNKETDPSKMLDSQEPSSPMTKNERPKKPLRLMGFGHRVYKEGDPRVPLAKKLALELFELLGKDYIGQLALDFEEIALKDEWIIQKKLLPNVDYWAAIILHTFGFPKELFTVIVAVPRTVGFLAHWLETLDDPELKIYRPRQIYVGEDLKSIIPVKERENDDVVEEHRLVGTSTNSNPRAAQRRGSVSPLDNPFSSNDMKKDGSWVPDLMQGSSQKRVIDK